jgi:hypothetical protein
MPEETIVYEISDYALSLEYAQEMMKQGYHVKTLIYQKEKPQPKTPLFKWWEGC